MLAFSRAGNRAAAPDRYSLGGGGIQFGSCGSP